MGELPYCLDAIQVYIFNMLYTQTWGIEYNSEYDKLHKLCYP